VAGGVFGVDVKMLESDHAGFSKIADYLRRESGINLTLSAKNQTLLASRLSKIMPGLGMQTYAELHLALLSGRRDIRDIFISAITTNTTHFFRERQHFDILRKLLAELQIKPEKKKTRELRVWCAACSSGEEAYSLAMTIRSVIQPADNWTIKILATDIDTEIMKKAARGVYPLESIDSVPENMRSAYFERGRGDSSDFVRVRHSLRELITFAPFNLMSPSYPFQFKFDFIFCRNVMIYFDKPEIQQTIRKMETCLRPGGHLFLGHSETIVGATPGLKSCAAAVYERISTLRKGEAA